MRKNITFSKIRKSFELSNANYASRHKSRHWDVFEADFLSVIDDHERWPNMLSNGLAQGMGGVIEKDSEFDQRCYARYGYIKENNFLDFFYELQDATVGNPFTCDLDGLLVNDHDLMLTINAWHLKKAIKPLEDRPINIIDIGAGHGNFLRKLKLVFPKSNIISLDLPETNAIQTWYLLNFFNKEEIFTSSDFYENSTAFNFDESPFLILPGFEFANIPNGWADIVINTRSMMEMSLGIVSEYFLNIHRVIRPGGYFYCVNRYRKTTTGEENRIKDYPFDSHWKVLINEPFLACLGPLIRNGGQPWIAELLVQRTAAPVSPSVGEVLEDCPPYNWTDCVSKKGIEWRRLSYVLFSSDPHIKLGILFSFIELVKNVLRKNGTIFLFLKKLRR